MANTFITKAVNARDFQAQIDNLNTKLDSVAKNLTYFDFYNIVDVNVNKNNFSAQVNALTPNTSLIINSEPFFLNNVYYNTGDIIFKSSNNNVVHVKAQTGGIYYPNKISGSSGSYSIEYKYTSTQPSIGTKSDNISVDSSVGEAKETITFTGLAPDATTIIYGLWQPFSASFKAYVKDNVAVQPYIKFYLYDKDNINYEEVCLDYSLTLLNNEWHINIEDIDTNKVNLWMKVK